MLQWIIIVAAVLLATGYVVWTLLLPLQQRQHLLDLLAARGVLQQTAARHRARLASSSCSRCGPATRRAHH